MEMDAGINQLTERIIGAAISVHRELGPGLLESAYEECLAITLADEGLAFERQGVIPVRFRGHEVTPGFRFDLLVEKQVILEVKAVEVVLKIHKAQVLTHLRMTSLPVGLILNFNSAVLRDGIHRLAIQAPLL
jgi:GxxExxY protein